MGRLPDHRQVTLYVKPELYERVRSTAYTLNEDIYEFVDEALADACDRRVKPTVRDAILQTVKQNLKNKGAARGKDKASARPRR